MFDDVLKEKKKQVDKEEKKELAGEEHKGQVEEEKETEKAKKKGEGENEGKNKEVILQVDLHCEGCGMKVKKAIRTVQGTTLANTTVSDKLLNYD